MKQFFNFFKSNNKIEGKSSIVSNKKAKIKEQNFIFNLLIDKKILLVISTILFFYLGFQYYQTKEINELKEKEKLVLEKKIKILNKRKNDIMNQKFNKEAAIKEIDKLVD